MQRFFLIAALCAAPIFAQTPKPADPPKVDTSKPIDIPIADALTIRTKQATAQSAGMQYQKVLDNPQVAKVRDTAEQAAESLQQSIKNITTRVCGENGQMSEIKDTAGDPKLVCYAAEKTAAPTKK